MMNATSIITPERFAGGMTMQQYVDGMTRNKELFEERYETFRLDEAYAAELRELALPLKVLVLLEDWCGDVLRYVPAFARIAEAAGTWEVRLLCRDENLDLADVWLKHGQFRSIPVIVFFDEQMNELGYFIEKPATVYTEDRAAREEFASLHPDLEDASLPSAEMSADTYNLYIEFMRDYRASRAARWQSIFAQEIMDKVRSFAGR